MEKQIKYIRVSADSKEICHTFETLMYGYIDELNEHSNRPLPKEFHLKWINSIIAVQGPTDRHLELCYVDGLPRSDFFTERSITRITRALSSPDTGILWNFM